MFKRAMQLLEKDQEQLFWRIAPFFFLIALYYFIS